MSDDQQLIDVCELLGYGVDINYMHGNVEIENRQGRLLRKFKSISAALKFVLEQQARIKSI